MAEYAKNTSVDPGQSRAEIERTLTRYGADQFMYGWSGETAIVAFRCTGRHVKFEIPMPDRSDRRFTHYRRGRYDYERTDSAALKEWEQATRQRWRALLLVIKAKLEAVESGISTFEAEFLAQTMLPDGRTVDQWLQPQIEEAYESNQMPAGIILALPAGPSA